MGLNDILWLWILSAILAATSLSPLHTSNTAQSGTQIERMDCSRSHQCALSGEGR